MPPRATAAVLAVLALAGCAPAPATPTPATPATPAPATPAPATPTACQLDDAAIAATRQLRISEISDGHQGHWSFHVDLLGHEGGDFVGTATATYQARSNVEPRALTRRLTWPRAELVALLDLARQGLRRAHDDVDARVIDTSRSIYLAIDLVGARGGLQLAVDDAEREPLDWRLRGCPARLAEADRQALTRRWRELHTAFGADAMFTELSGAPPWPSPD